MHFLILPLLTGTLLCAAEGPAVTTDPRFTEAAAQLQQLKNGTPSQRAEAGKKLLELGFYARDAVRKGMKSDDPEVATKCAAIWTEIELKVTPVEVPGLEAFIKAARDKHIDGEAWAQLVKSQGPSALVLVEPYLTAEFFAGEEGFSRDDKLYYFWSPLFVARADRLVAWSSAAPAQRALCRKALTLIKPGEDFAKQDNFLTALLRCDPDAILPYFEAVEGLPSAELTKLVLAEKELLLKMDGKTAKLRALSLSLRLLGADSRAAKAAVLKTLPEDAFVEHDSMLSEVLILLGDAGLADEARKLKSGLGTRTGVWRQFVDDIFAGKVVNIASSWEQLTKSTESELGNPEAVALALLGNGDPTRQRLASYLFPGNYSDLAFASLQAGFLNPNPDEVRLRAEGRCDQNSLYYLEQDELFLACVQSLNPGVLKSYEHYRMATLRQQVDASSYLDAALKEAPNCLPLLLEKALISPPAERSAAVRRACLALPAKQALGHWLLTQLSEAKVDPDAEVMAAWMKTIDFSKMTETHPALYSLIKLCLEHNLDASNLLPAMKKASSDKALVALRCGLRDEALAILKTMREEARMNEEGRFLEFLLGGTRPDVGANADEELAAVLAGYEGGTCPMSSERGFNQLRLNGTWELGKGFSCLRQGDAKGASGARETAIKAGQGNLCNSWLWMYQIFFAHPELLAPETKRNL